MAQVQQHHITGWTGWVLFAAAIMGLMGAVHILYGLAGIFSYSWYLYSSGTAYVFDATAWGWAMFIGGILLIISAISLASGSMFGRIVGGILITLSLLANIAMISVAPAWSIVAIIVDLLVLYAIASHGSELKNV